MQHYPFTEDQVNAFKSQVLAHVLTIEEDRWFLFRHHHALMSDRWVADGANPDASREELVAQAVMNCNVPARAAIAVRGAWQSVGEIARQLIQFNPRAGLYVWSISPDAGHTLQVWLSYPAMPKGW